jgi:hypothetical protein
MFDLNYLEKIAMRPPFPPEHCWVDLQSYMAPQLLSAFETLVKKAETDPSIWNKDDKQYFWKIIVNDESYYNLDPFISKVYNQFGADSMSLSYTQPWTSVIVHKDDQDRTASINCVLTADSSSTTYFITGTRRSGQDHFLEMPVTPLRYHLFREDCPHGMFNRGRPQLLFTLNLPQSIHFRDFRKWFREQQ